MGQKSVAKDIEKNGFIPCDLNDINIRPAETSSAHVVISFLLNLGLTTHFITWHAMILKSAEDRNRERSRQTGFLIRL